MERKLVLIDANSLIHRAYHALPLLRTSKGVYTNAVYGFTMMLLRLLEDEKPEYIVAAFDKKGPTFRHGEYAEYKAHREKIPEELSSQFPLLKSLLSAFNIAIFEVDGYEADDILGTISKKANEIGIETLIVTGDKDALQLVTPHTKVLLTRKGISEMDLYDEEKIKEKYGVTPEKLVDVKGLMGDPSDNIPGVPNIGEKTAVKLVKEFGSIENLLNNLENLKGKLKENLEKNKEQALLSRKLAEIVTEVPLEFDLEKLRYCKKINQDVIKVFKELEFTSLLKKVGFQNPQKDTDKNADFTTIDEIEILNEKLEEVKQKGLVALSIEVDEKAIQTGKIKGMSFCLNEDEIYFIHAEALSGMWEFLKPIFEDEKVKKIFHDAKVIYILLKNKGIKLRGLEIDTKIGAYLIDPTKTNYDLENLSVEFLNFHFRAYNSSKEAGEKSNTDDCFEVLKEYSCQKARALIKLKDVLVEKLKQNELMFLFSEIEIPLIEVLAEMEVNGISVDLEELKNLSREFGNKLESLTERIYDIAGVEFNINSPKQLGEVLFEKLGLPVIKKTKTGYSTGADVLQKLRNQHEIIDLILDYRTIMKLKSTYVDGLIGLIDKKTGKIHTSFNQTVTATGRLSSTEPNLQNIPVRLEIGRRIRKVFKAEKPGNVLLAADYSQIELRILAHLSEDENLIKAFMNDEDIHSKTASEIFGVKPEEVTPLMRSRAKAVNFGIVYGISDFGLAEDLGISRKEAQEYIDNYFRKYPKVRDYTREIIKKARLQGYVTTILNRRRYLPDIYSKNFNIRSFAERTAINTPIQGSAADIIKAAMIRVYRRLKNNGLSAKMILQVHDELIFDVPDKEIEPAKAIIKKEMEEVFPLKVPLKVDFKSGLTWFDMEKA